MRLRDVLCRVEDERLDVSPGFIFVLRAALPWYERVSHGGLIDELSADHVRSMMRRLMRDGKSPKTVNNYRYAILHLWEQSIRNGAPSPVPWSDVRPLRKVHRKPTAWTPDQLRRLIDACRNAPTLSGWGPVCWEALISTIYDTSLRVSCLLKSSIDQLDADRQLLLVPGELQKSREDTLQPLHPHTLALLLRIDRKDSRLLPWPFHARQLWRHLERHILIPANLPHTRRDKFHKIRRTSYTYVAAKYGVEVAGQHAAHKGDLSRFYLDRTMMGGPNPLDALPRPE